MIRDYIIPYSDCFKWGLLGSTVLLLKSLTVEAVYCGTSLFRRVINWIDAVIFRDFLSEKFELNIEKWSYAKSYLRLVVQIV